MRGLGNYDIWKVGGGFCGAMDASDLGLTQGGPGGDIGATFQTVGKDHPGYDPVCDCYCWGYKPEPVRIIGVKGLGAMGPLGRGWKVCHPLYSSAQRCPCSQDCPPQRECPTCPPPPPPPPCPTAQPPVVQETGPGEEKGPLEAYGVNLGLVAAGVLTAGVGYYGYKKGWFKRKKR